MAASVTPVARCATLGLRARPPTPSPGARPAALVSGAVAELDPATASGPLVTTISDAVGVLVHFSIASLFLAL